MELLTEVKSVYGSKRVGYLVCITTETEPRNEIVENGQYVCQINSQSYVLLLKLEANILTHPKKAWKITILVTLNLVTFRDDTEYNRY
jgi:hypothetical protein